MNQAQAIDRGTVSPWIHVLFWWLSALSGGSAVVALGMAVGTWIRDRNLPRLDVWIVFFGSSVVLVVLIPVWRRFVFSRRDLAAHLESRGGRIRSLRGRKLDARLGSLRVLARFDRPFLHYAPLPQINLRTLQWGGGYHPRYMHRMSRVDIFWLADLAGLPEVTVRVQRTRGTSVLKPVTGVDAVDRALRVAAEAIESDGVELAVQVRPRWLRVGVVGGTWLGGAFGTRIAEAVSFAERVVESLSTRYPPLDPDAWTIRQVDDDFVVSPVTRAA